MDHAQSSVKRDDDTSWKLFVGGGFKTVTRSVCITSKSATRLEELCSNQEEADTRIFLHLLNCDKHCALQEGVGRAIIKTLDTDVVVLAIHFFPNLTNIKEVWIETGNLTRTLDRHRFLPIHNICKSIGSTLCRILPAIHTHSQDVIVFHLSMALGSGQF